MTSKPPKQIAIRINGTTFLIDDGSYTGAQVKALGNVPANETLFLKHGSGEDRIEDDTLVKVHPNMEFQSAPDGGVS